MNIHYKCNIFIYLYINNLKIILARRELNMPAFKGSGALDLWTFVVFQLSCCGKGQGTSILTQFTDIVGLTELCPSSGAAVVSAIIHLNSPISTFMHQQLGHTESLCSRCSWIRERRLHFRLNIKADYVYMYSEGRLFEKGCTLAASVQHLSGK